MREDSAKPSGARPVSPPTMVMGSAQLVDHAADHHQLLVVLLAEHRHLGLHGVEELEHHGAHAGEEAGAEVAFEDVGQLGGRMHLAQPCGSG